MEFRELNKFSKETIIRALECNWLVKRDLENIIDACQSIEIDKVDKKYIELLNNSPKVPKDNDFKNTVKYMSAVNEHIAACERMSKKLAKLREERTKKWRD